MSDLKRFIEEKILKHFQEVASSSFPMYIEGNSRDNLGNQWFEPRNLSSQIRRNFSSGKNIFQVRISLSILICSSSENIYAMSDLEDIICNRVLDDIEGVCFTNYGFTVNSYGQVNTALKLKQSTVEVTYEGELKWA